MEISMKLNPTPFAMMKDGRKTIELRLCDEKRREISIGDIITFCNTEDPELQINAQVTGLYAFDSFADLLATLPLLECGYTEKSVANASPNDMDKYYSKEEQQKNGVIGIKVCLL
jgi:ASC-1-like (ASCH) protein